MDEMRNMREEEETIDLLEVGRILLKRWWKILLVMMIVGAATYGLSTFFIQPKYQSGFTAYINNNKEQPTESVSSQDITAARSLVSTYGAIIKSRSVVEEAIERTRADCTYKDLEDAVTVEAVDDTEIIQVNVVTADAGLSYDLAKALQKVSADRIFRIMEAGSMSVINTAEYPSDIYSPNYIKLSLIAAVLAGILFSGVILLREWMDDRIKGAEKLEEWYGIPVLGIIHDLTSANVQKGGYGYEREK